MPTDILMPALSPTMTEGKLARWLKKPGDSINPGDVIAEIETDKATMEIEAIDEGTLGEIKVQDGTEGVAVNAVIATLLGSGESVGAKSAPKVAEAPAPKAEAPAPKAEAPKAAPAAAAPAPAVAPAKNGAAHHDDSRVAASPLARRMAAIAGIDLNNIKGSGPGGRVVKADLESASPRATAPALRTAGSTPASAPFHGTINARKQADQLGMKYEAKPVSNVRKVIARRLTEAKQTIPHFYVTVDCEIDALLELRKRYNAVEGQPKASINDFAIRAAALALRKIPDANVSWADDAILHYADVDISVAVATDNGLITPIIRKADTKTPRQIGEEMRELAGRAREGKLKPQEFQGGTFSISNLGMYGVSQFGAIVNPPQACILAVAAGEPRAVVRDGQIVVRNIMTCTLSVDHRAVDGALGAEYMAAFKALLEEPYSLF